jgi:hypothetical protein
MPGGCAAAASSFPLEPGRSRRVRAERRTVLTVPMSAVTRSVPSMVAAHPVPRVVGHVAAGQSGAASAGGVLDGQPAGGSGQSTRTTGQVSRPVFLEGTLRVEPGSAACLLSSGAQLGSKVG